MVTLALKDTFRLARTKMGLSQDQLARRLDVSNTTIRNYEKGRRGSKADPSTLWNFSNIAPPEFREGLRRFVPENFRRAVEQTSAEIDQFLKPLERRYSNEAVSQLHQALDIIIDRAPSEVIQQVTELLTKQAGQWGDRDRETSRHAVVLVPAEVMDELNGLSSSQRLDKSHILRDALSLGLGAISRRATAQRQVKFNKEAHKRANPRS